MPIKKLVRVLDTHSIPNYVENDRVFALNEYTPNDGNGYATYKSNWVQVTDWSMRELLNWLGY